mgnify:CR=1 FL=1
MEMDVAITPDLARALNLATTTGALVSNIEDGSPAASAADPITLPGQTLAIDKGRAVFSSTPLITSGKNGSAIEVTIRPTVLLRWRFRRIL